MSLSLKPCSWEKSSSWHGVHLWSRICDQGKEERDSVHTHWLSPLCSVHCGSEMKALGVRETSAKGSFWELHWCSSEPHSVCGLIIHPKIYGAPPTKGQICWHGRQLLPSRSWEAKYAHMEISGNMQIGHFRMKYLLSTCHVQNTAGR